MTRSDAENLPVAEHPLNSGAAFDFAAFAAEFGGTSVVRIKAGTAVYRQGEPAPSLFYLRQGRIRINVVSPEGKEAIMAILGDDAIFGETCLLGEATRAARATCLTDCVIVRIEKPSAMAALASSFGFAEFLLVRSLRRVARLRGQLISQLFDSSEQRLARILLTLANYGRGGWQETTIDKVDQEDLAQMVGTTRARISGFMNKFRRLGYIDYNGKIAVYRSLSKVLLNEASWERAISEPAEPAGDVC
ncbi:MAG TPA: Crp/Fnr family transcriptional regulator [Xanthobacteraceae bacterium]|jgi:CRP-like cAMP-binding protein|nr:Crp/Fnr family transcriptional regulator [Xanthobacteraceae bacterium]